MVKGKKGSCGELRTQLVLALKLGANRRGYGKTLN